MNALTRRRALLAGALGLGLAACAGMAWLPSAAPGRSRLSGEELDIVDALGRALFPGGPLPAWAELSPDVDALLADALTPATALPFRYLLRAMELAAIASHGHGIARMKSSDILDLLNADPVGVARDGLRAVLGLAYFNHPRVLAHLGYPQECVR